jgi:hypothetical protein
VVTWYLDYVMHVVTSLAIMQMVFRWMSSPGRPVYPMMHGGWVTATLFTLFLVEILLRTFYVPDWTTVRLVRARTWKGRVRAWWGECWHVLRTQVFDKWYLLDLVALISFIEFRQLRLLRGFRTLKALARVIRLTRLARIAKQFRPKVTAVLPRLPANPYLLLFGGNAVVLVGAALILAGLEECSFGKALSWSAQVFYAGESFYTGLEDPRARAFGDLIKIPGVAFYAVLIGLVPDMLQRLRRLIAFLLGSRLQSHYVVFGWGQSAYSLLKALLTLFPRAIPRVVVVGEAEEPEELKELGVRYMRGPMASLRTLERVAVRKARIVIVPPYHQSTPQEADIDGRTFLLASHIAAAGRPRRASRLIACTESQETYSAVKRLGGIPVDTRGFGGHILSQALLKPGLERVFEQLLPFAKPRIFVERVPRRWASRSFSDLSRSALTQRVRPVGMVRDGSTILVPDPETATLPLRQSQAIVYIADNAKSLGAPARSGRVTEDQPDTGTWHPDRRGTDWEGRKLLVIGCNAQLGPVIRNLQTVPAEIHVMLSNETARAWIDPPDDRVRIEVGPLANSCFLRPFVADDALAGVLILEDLSGADDAPESSHQGAELLMRIREIQHEQQRPRCHVVVETSSIADHARLHYLNGLYASGQTPVSPDGSAEDLGLVCVEDLSNLLVTHALGDARVVEVFEDIMNAAKGSDVDVTGSTLQGEHVTFREVASAFERGEEPGVPIGLLRGTSATLNPPSLFELQQGDRVVYLKKTRHLLRQETSV